MVESVLTLLIVVAILIGLVWLVIWVLGQLGVPLPPNVMKAAWVIVVLVVLLLLWRAFGHGLALRL